jgi:hypothetical protein
MSKKNNALDRWTHRRMEIKQQAAQGRGEMTGGNEKSPPQDCLKPNGLPHHLLCSNEAACLTASSPATKPSFCIGSLKRDGTRLR